EPGYVAGRTLRQMIGNELVGIGIVTAIAIPVSAFLMLIGYIGADARRRGMSGLLWVLVSLLVPYLIGIILYFIVRDPLSLDCPQCGSKVNPHFNFCPGCQFNLRPNCPQCRRAVATGAHFCPHCGFKLQAGGPAEQVAPAP
ncbi:MAG TPA: zinc ribbon domain-containing protein, partial [Terriglobia bacterium]|nr:zinc ribbon domain-containing protein [Terriglobia bacterium]